MQVRRSEKIIYLKGTSSELKAYANAKEPAYQYRDGSEPDYALFNPDDLLTDAEQDLNDTDPNDVDERSTLAAIVEELREVQRLAWGEKADYVNL